MKSHLKERSLRSPRPLLSNPRPCVQTHSRTQLFPGDIVEYPRNKYFSHFAVYYGERDGVAYVAHLTCRGQCSVGIHIYIVIIQMEL